MVRSRTVLPASDSTASKLDGAGTEAQESSEDLHSALAAPEPVPKRSYVARAETAELDRRVLAVERILQARTTNILRDAMKEK